MKMLVTIKEVSGFLKVKESTLYSWVNNGSIPSYKLNGLLRFDMKEIEEWISRSRISKSVPGKTIKKASRNQDIDRLVKKAIDDVTGNGYNSANGKPDQGQGLGKGVDENGTL